MTLPFTHEAFLEVFARYNTLLWPAVAALWAITVFAALAWLRTGRLTGRVAFGLLAVHWGWSAIAYHWFFFRSINPAAVAFAAMFLIQATVFVWLAATSRGSVVLASDTRGVISAALVLYGLAYPFLGVAFGLRYPFLPLFAVPCPTTMVTAGLLLGSIGVPRMVNLVPLVWAVIGSSAAFVLGIRADFALLAAGIALGAAILRRHVAPERR